MPHPPALFIADAVGLDFLNSVATPADTPVDWLDHGAGLLSWLEQAHLVSRSTIDEIRQRALPGELDKVAAQARDLREWFRGFVHQHQGVPLSAAAMTDLQPLNLLLARDERYGRLVEQDGRLTLQTLRHWRFPESLLQPIGEALAQLLAAENFAHIKGCEGAGCTLLFADHTRGHSRRWCNMEVCGNRAKQAAHRHRRKEHP